MRSGSTAALLLAAVLHGEIVDRISVVVDRIAIKHSDIEREIRSSAFINGEQADFSADSQKKAAAQLIDQAIIRKEIQAGAYPEPQAPRVDQLFQQIRRRYPTAAAFQAALAQAGISEQQLRDQLRWQLKVLEFIRIRFGTGTPGAEASASEANDAKTNQQLFTWLDETRKQTRVVFKEGSLK